MPSNTLRAGNDFLPPPGLRLYSLPSTRARAGISGSTRAQNSSDTFQLAKRRANFDLLSTKASWSADDKIFASYLRISSKFYAIHYSGKISLHQRISPPHREEVERVKTLVPLYNYPHVNECVRRSCLPA